MARMAEEGTSVGPSSVTCDGMNSASGSPASARAWSSALPHGSGIPIATPTRSVCTSGTAGRGQEADPLVHRAQRDGGDRAGLLGADREHLVQAGRVVEQLDDPIGRGRRLGHLRRRVLQVGDLRGVPQDVRLRHGERLAVQPVEPLRQVAGQLQVLALVLPHRYRVGLVEQDVRGLQDRVGEQAHAGPVGALLAGLVLELGHPAGLTEPGQAPHHPAELRVPGHVRLHEQRAPLGVQPEREELGRGDPGALAQQRRLVSGGDRVQVDHAVERVVAVLQGHPVAHRSEVVAQVEGVGGGLDAGQYPRSALGHAKRIRRRDTAPPVRISYGRGGGTIPTRATRRPSRAVTTRRYPLTSTSSPTRASRPSRAMRNPPSVSYGPAGSRNPQRSAKSTRLSRPSTSLGTSPSAGSGSGARSYSSAISPTSSSMRSSSVTMPAVPPYSSTTTARCRPSRRISDSAGSTRLLAGRRLTSRASSPTVATPSGSGRINRSRRCTKPITSSCEPSITGNRECRAVRTAATASASGRPASRNTTSVRGTMTSRTCRAPAASTSSMMRRSSPESTTLAATRSRSSASEIDSRPAVALAPSALVTHRVRPSAARTTIGAKARPPRVSPGRRGALPRPVPPRSGMPAS